MSKRHASKTVADMLKPAAAAEVAGIEEACAMGLGHGKGKTGD
jgi:hypothetical protein